MTAYDYITFDPIGYLPFNRYSSIVSFKNVLLYKFLKDLEPDDYGNDQAHQENANQKIAKCFNEFTKFLRKETVEVEKAFRQSPFFCQKIQDLVDGKICL